MKKLTSIAFILLLLSTFNGCNKSPKCWGKKESSIGIISADFDPCLNCNIMVNPNQSYVINSNREYQDLSLLAHSNQTVCQFENINFNNYTLLGKPIWASCKHKIKRDVTEDTSNNKYIYTIEIKECGECSELNMVENWVLVPKIPSGYTVDFIIIKN
tara:strand:+ start:707 stop:1180 length:474 start_codon:yes stop_codon:yes gene_type:complete